MALPEQDNEREEPVIRDTRRIDPETGELRVPVDGSASSQPGGSAQQEQPPAGDAAASGDITADTDGGTEPAVDAATAEAAEAGDDTARQLAERIADLQRLQAEYANYRKRVERDRASMREQLVAQLMGELLPVLDDIGRAREHDELTGGFKSVGEALESVASKMGLTKYAQPGDEFDPNVHEALTMVPSPDATTQTVLEVFQPGYSIGERVIRPARVVVTGPAAEETAATTDVADEEPPTPTPESGPESSTADTDASNPQAGERE
ncbi:nucleotide exchange factor GrpE [Lipingzhangella sp. LS1_29]|uniref:Protein GrpE n=1 Tax=Lipingzhangella rawalii TaxID=2055835 RepID=A0ABU2H449_9ACTN|nr:nucleotide exchange factor GrpE [Lipingzhangella rawalii]MDS1270089.1 nucleotide exchange factor GrpE [Lipingzhangella rawalii]